MEKFRLSYKKILIIGVILVLAIFLLFNTSKVNFLIGVVSPVICGIFIAFLMDTIVRFLTDKWKFKRSLAILSTCIFVVAIIVFFILMVIPQIINNAEALINSFSEKDSEISKFVANIKDVYNNQYAHIMGDELIKFEQEIKNFIIFLKDNLFPVILPKALSFGSTIIMIFTTFILSLYMLIEKNDLIARIKRFIFAYLDDKKAQKLMHGAGLANQILKNYVIGKIIDSTLVGLLNVLFFWIFGVPNPVLMGVIIGVCNLVPYFGPIIGTIPVFLITLVISPVKALVAFAIILVIGQIDANFIDPKIVGDNTGVTPFWVITAVTIGSAAFGFAGMLFGVPVAILIKKLVEENIEEKLKEKGIEDFEKENLKIEKKEKLLFRFKKK